MLLAPGFSDSSSDVLFLEDFDAIAEPPAPEVAPEPVIAEPSFSADEMNAAKEEAFAEGHRAGIARAVSDRAEVTRQMLTTIAEELSGACHAAARLAEESAEAVARLLLRTLGTVLPELCARHGEAEIRAVARAILPTLAREPRITIRVSPHVTASLEQELASLDPDLRNRILVMPTDAVPPGDTRIAWEDGAAVRNTAAVWRSVAEALAPLGLIDALPAKAGTGNTP
jgi:flagellar assembly protein FliH